ncbi:hypothetical protein D1872_260210 [compost metagenome]
MLVDHFECGKETVESDIVVHPLETIDRRIGNLIEIGRSFDGPVEHRSLLCDRIDRNIGDLLTVPEKLHIACIGHLADNSDIEIPLLEDLDNLFFIPFFGTNQHPLL